MGLSADRHYRYYVLFLLFLVSVINFMDRQVFSLLLESIKKDLDVSDTRIGLLAGLSFAIFHSVAGLPLARLSDTGSRRTVLAVGMFAWSVFALLRIYTREVARRCAASGRK